MNILVKLLKAVAFPFVLIYGIVLGLIRYNTKVFEPTHATRFVPKDHVKRVGIIGAGSSGITAAKEALEAGFEVVLFEQMSELGGNWVFKETECHASVYRSTVINTSKHQMCFSDFPMAPDFPTHPHHREIVAYFEQYARHFNVLDKIKFNTRVKSVDLIDNDRWRVLHAPVTPGTSTVIEDQTSQDIFDAIMICNGHHNTPRMPNFPGQDKFKGHLMHSHAYKDPKIGYDFQDKNVVVVGIGNSAVDLACELSRVSRRVYLSTRTGAWVLPKWTLGMSSDLLIIPRFLAILLPPAFAIKILSPIMQFLMTCLQGSMASWGLDPGCDIQQTHPTVSQELLMRIGTGSVKVKPNIKQFTENTVVFDDNSEETVDAVIFCTGYKITFPFVTNQQLLPVGENNELRLYKNVFSPTAPLTLAVIGLVQPIGAIMTLAEMQSRWVAQVFKGTLGLPEVAEMNQWIDNYQESIRRRYIKRARHTIQVDAFAYLEDIAIELGAVPHLKNNKDVLLELLFLPVLSPMFRLEGIGAKPVVAKQLLREFWQEIIRGKRPETLKVAKKNK